MVDIENPSPGRGLTDDDDEGEAGPQVQQLSREMTGWKEICDDLGIPSETEKYCDYVLVFDEIVEEEMREAKNRTGCCGCCEQSYKELEECMKVKTTLITSTAVAIVDTVSSNLVVDLSVTSQNPISQSHQV